LQPFSEKEIEMFGNPIRRRLFEWSRLRRPAVYAVAIAAIATMAVRGQEQEASTSSTDYAEFQYSTLTGSTNTITATLVPVVTGSTVKLYNVTLLFTVNASGQLTLAKGYPQVVAAPPPIFSNFLAGNYVGPSTVGNPLMALTVSSPSQAQGGATEWSLVSSTGANPCTYPASASWFVGPIASSPWAARIQKAGITNPNISYGVGSSAGCVVSPGVGAAWISNSLLGFAQDGNTLTIYSYSYDGTDYSQSTDSIVYTFKTQ
jgi:hypothetical protein